MEYTFLLKTSKLQKRTFGPLFYLPIMSIEILIGGFVLFVLGYLIGRVDVIHRLLRKQEKNVVYTTTSTESTNSQKRIKTDSDTPALKPPKITIDESKFVTTIKTDSFQKDFDDLGNTTTSEDNIKSSISKLSQLKRNKE